MKKIEQFLFYLLIFSIPFETRLIVKQWTYQFNEWASVFLYGTDILIGFLFLFWLMRIMRGEKEPQWRKSDYALAGFFIISIFSLSRALIFKLGLYQMAKLAEFIFLYRYIVSASGKILNIRKILAVLIASGLFQAFIAIVQYLKQSEIGLKFLGETVLRPDMPAVAVIIADGGKFLRSYGTTLHPNVLAAFLFLAVYSFYFLYFYKGDIGMGIKLIPVYIFLIFGFLFTFSRIIIFLWLLGAIIHGGFLFFKKSFRSLLKKAASRMIFIITVTCLILAVFAFLFYPQVVSRMRLSSADQAVNMRIWYTQKGIETLKKNMLGVGIGNFVPFLMKSQQDLPFWQYQPIHNVYLLIASETGLLGLAIFLLFLLLAIKEYISAVEFRKFYHYSLFLIFISFLIIGFFDHFIWTLQVGRLMFWLTLSILAAHIKNPNLFTV